MSDAIRPMVEKMREQYGQELALVSDIAEICLEVERRAMRAENAACAKIVSSALHRSRDEGQIITLQKIWQSILSR